MMTRKSRMEQLSVVADSWSLKLKAAKLKGSPFLSHGISLCSTPHVIFIVKHSMISFCDE